MGVAKKEQWIIAIIGIRIDASSQFKIQGTQIKRERKRKKEPLKLYNEEKEKK